MMNTGDGPPVPSTHGLLTTVAYQLGKDASPVYALEGSVAFSGSVIQWLRDQLQIIQEAPDSETEAAKVSSNEDLYFVPAFAGLFAPYWRDDARGCIVGLTATHTKSHVCRAALEATAYQARELFDAMSKDSFTKLQVLKVDGGATANALLMQFQSDMIGVPVVTPQVIETTAVGAAFAAGLAVGVWDSLDEIQAIWTQHHTWTPSMSQDERTRNWTGWKKAVSKSFGWVIIEEEEDTVDVEMARLKLAESQKKTMMYHLSLLATAAVAAAVGFVLGSNKRLRVSK
jgi:glycerol kinase